MSREAVVNLVQHKALTDKSLLRTGYNNFALNDCSMIELVGYSITGTAGSIPAYLLLTLNNDETSVYFSVRDGATENIKEQKTAFVLYPPGGAVTQGMTRPKIKFGRGTRSLQGAEFKLEAYDTATNSYVPFTDYTTAVIELRVVAHPHTPVRHGLQ